MSYERIFIPLSCETRGYEFRGRPPAGRCIVECRGTTGRINLTAQDLKPETLYDACLIFEDGGRYAGVNICSLHIDERGKGEAKYDINPLDLFGFNLADIASVAVTTDSPQGMASPLCGYRINPFAWRNSFYLAENVMHEVPPTEKSIRSQNATEPPSMEETKLTPTEDLNQPDSSSIPQPAEIPTEHSHPLQTSSELPPSAENDTSIASSIEENPPTSNFDPLQAPQELPPPTEHNTSTTTPNETKSTTENLDHPETLLELPHVEIYPTISTSDETLSLDENSNNSQALSELPLDENYSTLSTPFEDYPYDENNHSSQPSTELPSDEISSTISTPSEIDIPIETSPEPPFSPEQSPTTAGIESFQNAVSNMTAHLKEHLPETSSLQEIFANNPPVNPFENLSHNIRWVKITSALNAPTPINRPNLFSDDFVQAAFNSHQHLLLGLTEDQQKYIIGLPSLYSPEDRKPARRLGFGQFKCITSEHPSLGEFGYWLMLVSL